MVKPLIRPGYVTAISLTLLFGGFLLDLTTTQNLVVAIIYNIPIALSGLALSRSLTVWTTVLALAANIAAGYENALVIQGYDAITLLNRSLAALSFILVGMMTFALARASDQVSALAAKEAEAQRERDLRAFMLSLAPHASRETLLQAATEALRKLLKADAVVLSNLDGDRFVAPRYSTPRDSGVAKVGTLASWAIDAIPETDRPVITVRSNDGVMSVGRCQPAGQHRLIVIAANPGLAESSTQLNQALKVLAGLLERTG